MGKVFNCGLNLWKWVLHGRLARMHSYRVSVKDRGRLLIPASLREQALLGDEVELVATPLPGGGFTVKTRQQILESFWSRVQKEDGVDLVEEQIRESSIDWEQRQYSMDNPAFEILSEEAQHKKDLAILAKMGL